MRAFAILVTMTTLAHAGKAYPPTQPDPTKEKIRDAFSDGIRLELDGRLDEALAKFRVAAALWNHPQIHFHEAKVLVRLGRGGEAADEARRALEIHAPDLFTPEQHAWLRWLPWRYAFRGLSTRDMP